MTSSGMAVAPSRSRSDGYGPDSSETTYQCRIEPAEAGYAKPLDALIVSRVWIRAAPGSAAGRASVREPYHVRQEAAMVNTRHIPEPARSALLFIGMYQTMHPKINLPEAVRVARILGQDQQFLSWHDDGKGRFEVKSGDRVVLMLDLTPLIPTQEP